MVKGEGDVFKTKKGKEFVTTGINWLSDVLLGLDEALTTSENYVTVDMSNLNWINLYEWMSVVSILDKILCNKCINNINLDFVGDANIDLLSGYDYVKYLRNEEEITNVDMDNRFKLSNKVYKLVGYLESLQFLSVLRNPKHQGKVSYQWVNLSNINIGNFYNRNGDKPTVVLGMTRIESKDDCVQFLDEKQILNWRNAMDKRFHDSPLFEFEELWRVVCHELAANIWEHAEATGFMSARIVFPLNAKKEIAPWCQATYKGNVYELIKNINKGFLELCISDAGNGFIKTLELAFRKRQKIPVNKEVSPEDVVAFAFDVYGTCKADEESWATERHALGRILNITAKYGGALVIRTSNIEISYISKGGRLARKNNKFEFQPAIKMLDVNFPGAHIQLILPLYPPVQRAPQETRSVLLASLPNSFQTDANHVKGHLVPVLEYLNQIKPGIGAVDAKAFRIACTNLNNDIIKCRPKSEPLIFDLGQLNWEPPQFETFLHMFQNIIQNRPVLFVELEPSLAIRVANLEENEEATALDKEYTNVASSVTGKTLSQISEHKFLETYSRVHATILVIDRNGNKHIFGLPYRIYGPPLLDLIEMPLSLDGIINKFPDCKQYILATILNPTNHLFEVDGEGKWRCIWDDEKLSIETKRVMTRHFDHTIDRCQAWRGRVSTNKETRGDSGDEVFNLPWEDEWLGEFLECSRVLSRERNADEAAQRLIYRLSYGLESIGKNLDDVKVLACVTAPALLLATAMHRWWPNKHTRPTVADFGYYVLLGQENKYPLVDKEGGIVIVQDILDTHKISNKLLRFFREEKFEVFCILSLIRMIRGLKKTRITTVDDGWLLNDLDVADYVPCHAMIEMKRPKAGTPPKDNEDDTNAFWVEPRTLRPIRYSTLRREFEEGRDPILDRRNECLKLFDVAGENCLLAAGHYIYGKRHYTVAVDTRGALVGEIGDMIAGWVADICEGVDRIEGVNSVPWEKGGLTLKGDVTAVLMPLHSQIHYLWPKVANLLAQRGRRVPLFLLDATIFSGRGTAYRIPDQLIQQIRDTIRRIVDEPNKNHPKLRILILDDSIASGRTIETILGYLMLLVDKEYNKPEFKNKRQKSRADQSPFEWIRYFALLNQMGHAHHMLWHNIKALSDPSIPIVFEEFAPFMGVPVYDEGSCPKCRDIYRLEKLKMTCEKHSADNAWLWADDRINNLKPVAIDSPGSRKNKAIRLQRPIDPLQPRLRPRKPKNQRYIPQHVDTSIWSFYELMYLSYPPGDILKSLDYALAPVDATIDEVREYDKYRFAVFEWCLNNWARLIANTARARFVNFVKKEVDRNSSIAIDVIEYLSVQYSDEHILKLIADCITFQAKLEKGRTSTAGELEVVRISKTLALDTGLTSFFLNVPTSDRDKLVFKRSGKDVVGYDLLSHLNDTASSLDSIGHSLIRNLHRRLTRPLRHAEPSWALNTIAESLFRGRSCDDPIGHHDLLPKLIDNVLNKGANDEHRRLLQGSLSMFLAGLEDLMPYGLDYLSGVKNVKDLSERILEWLKYPTYSLQGTKIPREALRHLLNDGIHPKKVFCSQFNSVFQESVNYFEKPLMDKSKRINDQEKSNLVFSYIPDEDVKECSVMTHVGRLLMCLENWTIDPIKGDKQPHVSRVSVHRLRFTDRPDRICFKLLTNFKDHLTTDSQTSHSSSSDAERNMLTAFGANLDKSWSLPLQSEKNEGFTALFKFDLPMGFDKRSQK